MYSPDLAGRFIGGPVSQNPGMFFFFFRTAKLVHSCERLVKNKQINAACSSLLIHPRQHGNVCLDYLNLKISHGHVIFSQSRQGQRFLSWGKSHVGEVRRSQRGGEEKKESGMRKEGKQEQLKERMIRLMEKRERDIWQRASLTCNHITCIYTCTWLYRGGEITDQIMGKLSPDLWLPGYQPVHNWRRDPWQTEASGHRLYLIYRGFGCWMRVNEWRVYVHIMMIWLMWKNVPAAWSGDSRQSRWSQRFVSVIQFLKHCILFLLIPERPWQQTIWEATIFSLSAHSSLTFRGSEYIYMCICVLSHHKILVPVCMWQGLEESKRGFKVYFSSLKRLTQ